MATPLAAVEPNGSIKKTDRSALFDPRIGYNPGVSERSAVAEPRSQARKRILDAAYDLFSTRGIRAVGIDEIVESAAVAKATLYRHFRTKDELVLSFLEQREKLWTKEFFEAEVRRRGATPDERLFVIFDVFDEWFRGERFEACSFINTLLEMGPEHVLGKAAVAYLENIRGLVATLAAEAGLRDTESFASSWQLLMKGSIVSAAGGDLEAAQRAKAMARLVVEQYR
jgi:AcrR family transcriptional regulator